MHPKHRAVPVNHTKSTPEPHRRCAERRLARSAAASSLVLGLGFGLPCAYGLWYFATRNEVWIFLGFPTYGGGPFDAAGMPTTVPLLTGFLIVGIIEVVAAVLLWRPRRSGYVIGLLLLPFEAVFWIGFALPFGPLLGGLRTALVLAAAWVGSRIPDGVTSRSARRGLRPPRPMRSSISVSPRDGSGRARRNKGSDEQPRTTVDELVQEYIAGSWIDSLAGQLGLSPHDDHQPPRPPPHPAPESRPQGGRPHRPTRCDPPPQGQVPRGR